MNILTKLKRPGKETGRHRAEPQRHYGPGLFFLITLGLVGSAIIYAFIAQGNPRPAAVQYQPSYNPAPPPHVFPPVRQASPPASTYTVVAGDKLWTIAYRECGNGLAWKKIQAKNSINPWWLHPGQKLTISC